MKQILTISFIIFSCSLSAQNLEKIGKEDMVKVSGGINFSNALYFQSGLVNPYRDPYTWFASGNININILDVSLPFTYSYSNQGGNFTQPFNRMALHPTYKWAKAHLGQVSMSFSPYSLNGYVFLGGGVELTPGKWNIQAMGGRLQKEIEYDVITANQNEIAYRRWGYGVKAGYADKGYSGEIIIFKANDQKNSLSNIPLNSEVTPQDNLVISLKGSAKIATDLNVEAEYALSGLTQNTRNTDDLQPGTRNFLYGLINGNATSDFFHAFNSSVNYTYKNFAIGAKFEHVDAGYKTLGGYYFNNDLQNYTLTPTITLFKNKLNIAINSGFQRNNLTSKESSTTNRWIGSANVSYVPNPKLILNGSYSNFSTFTRNRPVIDPYYYQPADTLNFYQLTQAASAMVSTNWGNKDLKSVVQLLFNYQESVNLSGNISSAGAFGTGLQTNVIGVPAKTYIGNVGYTTQFVRISGSMSLGVNYTMSDFLDQKTSYIGPTLSFQKSLMDKKANISFGTTYNRQYTNTDLNSNVLNHRISFSWNPKFENEKAGQFGLSLNTNLLQRFAIQTGNPNVHEMNVFLNLSYNISPLR